MKISNSKKQLAKIISENGGWREGAEWSAQDRFSWGCSNRIVFYTEMPQTPKGEQRYWSGEDMGHRTSVCVDELLPKWSETNLSRDEYFHLYPAPGAVVVENKTTCHLYVTDKPTIEQLAAEYRNRKDYAERKQQEADAAKAEAEAKLAELVAAGKAVGLAVSVAAQEPVITDWRDLQVGDMVWCCEDEALAAGEYVVLEVEEPNYDGVRTVLVNGSSAGTYWIDSSAEWRFIRRPAKGDADA